MHLTHLTRTPGKAFAIPLDSIMLVEEAPKSAPCQSAVFYDTGNGPTPVQLDDNFGYLEKLMNDAGLITGKALIQLHQATPDGEARLLIPHRALVTLAEQEEDANGGKTVASLRLGETRNVSYVLSESFEEINDIINPKPEEPVKPRRKRKGTAK